MRVVVENSFAAPVNPTASLDRDPEQLCNARPRIADFLDALPLRLQLLDLNVERVDCGLCIVGRIGIVIVGMDQAKKVVLLPYRT